MIKLAFTGVSETNRMKNQRFIMLFFLLFSGFGFAQMKEIDSLKGVVSTSKIAIDRAGAFERLCWLHIQRDAPKAKVYLDSARVLYTFLKDANNLADLQYKNGVLDRFLGNYDAAIEKFDLYKKHCEQIKDSINISNTLYQKGVVYTHKGDYKKALEQQYQALKMYENMDISSSVAFTLNVIGHSFRSLRQFEKAEGFYLRAISINEKNKDNNNLADAYSSLGSLYDEMKKHEKGLIYFKKCLVLDSISGNQWGIASDFQNIGIAHYNLKDYQRAIKNLEKALEIQKENNFKSDMIFVMSKLGSTHLKLKNFELSENYLKEALSLESGSLKTDQEINGELKSLYELNGNYKDALYYSKEEEILKDSIFKKDNLKTIHELNLKYETEKKDNEILAQELTISENKSKTLTMNILIVSLLLGSILLWFSFQQRQKRMQQQLVAIEREQEVRTLESLMEGEEKERFRIAKELHDGVNGDLSAIKFKLSSLLEMNNSVIKEAVAMIDNSCEQVRAISHNLVPPSLKNFSLLEAVDEYCQSMNSIHDPEVHFQQVGAPINLDKKQEANLFRIIQELVTNSIKHAEAKEINVQLSHLENTLQLTVEDNGKGFDPKTVKSDGIGMQNVQSRIDYLNATMDFISNEKGTSYTIAMDTKKEES